MPAPVLPRSAVATGRVLTWVLLGVAVLVVAATAWLGVRGALAASHLESARAAARAVTNDLADPKAAAVASAQLSAETDAARALTSDPIWRAAETLPWIGPQLRAVGTVASSAALVADDALTPLVDAASSFSVDSLRPEAGGIDVTTITALRDSAASAAHTVGAAAAAVDEIDATELIGPVRAPVAEAAAALTQAREAADALNRASRLLPSMLGADGPRNYLVVFQNNAEWRSLGGIVGAMAMIHTENGRMTLAAQGSSSDFRRYAEPVLPLSDEQRALFTNRPALYIQNVTQIPDFTVAAPLVREMWKRETGTEVDGVIAIDPVAVSYLLTATGTVRLPTGDSLTADNAVPLLLNEVYQRYPRPSDQDAFFAQAAASVFEALAGGSVDPARMVSALATASDERRLLLWSAHPQDQRVLDGTTLQGTLPASDGDTSTFGVYLNDSTGSKMDYYVDVQTGTTWCSRRDGASDALLQVSLTNTLIPGTALPSYITGGGTFGVPVGSAKTLAYVYLPPGAQLAYASPTGKGTTAVTTTTIAGRTVVSWESTLGPRESATLHVRVKTPQTAELRAIMTPGVHAPASVLAPRCEDAQ